MSHPYGLALRHYKRDADDSSATAAKKGVQNEVGLAGDRLQLLQNENVRRIQKMKGPSSEAKPSHFRKQNNSANPIIRNLRPSNARGPPISLFSEVFGNLFADMSKQRQVASPQLEFVNEYISAALDLYEDEHLRVEALHPILEKLLGCDLAKVSIEGDKAILDDVCLINQFFAIIVEYKNEIGATGTDAGIQVSLGYSKYVAQEKVSTKSEPF